MTSSIWLSDLNLMFLNLHDCGMNVWVLQVMNTVSRHSVFETRLEWLLFAGMRNRRLSDGIISSNNCRLSRYWHCSSGGLQYCVWLCVLLYTRLMCINHDTTFQRWLSLSSNTVCYASFLPKTEIELSKILCILLMRLKSDLSLKKKRNVWSWIKIKIPK